MTALSGGSATFLWARSLIIRNPYIIKHSAWTLGATTSFVSLPKLSIGEHRQRDHGASDHGGGETIRASFRRPRQEEVPRLPPGFGCAVADQPRDRRRGPHPIEPIRAFYLFFAAGLVAALFAPIQDCDETFNYWEPLHYLSHGYGLQTWEYSPDYAIRSWLYVVLHAIVGNARRLLPHSTKVMPKPGLGAGGFSR